MGVLDEYAEQIKTSFSNWVQVVDNKSTFTLDDFPYNLGVDENKTGGHCWKCVTVNNCWFKNEKDKKPEKFNYLGFDFLKMFGLYHPYCHCKEIPTVTPSSNMIKVEMQSGKIDFFFKDKLNWFYSWGYTDDDKTEFIEMIKRLGIQSYCNGEYEKVKHTNAGYQINIFITIPGKNQKSEHSYKVKSCYIIYPNLKLRSITLIGGRVNETVR